MGLIAQRRLRRCGRALSQFIVQGIDTSIPLHQAIIDDPHFLAGEFDTGFMERFLAARGAAEKQTV